MYWNRNATSKLNQLALFSLAATSLAVPLYFYVMLGPVKITISAAAMFLCVIFWLASKILNRTYQKLTWFDWAALAFLMASMFSWFPALDKGAAIKETIKYAAFILLIMASRDILSSTRSVNIVLTASLAAGAFASFLGLFQFFQERSMSTLYRIDGFFGNPNSLGSFLAMIIVLATALSLWPKNPAKWFTWALVGLAWLIELLTNSRGGVLGAMVGSLVVIALFLAQHLNRITLFKILLVVVLSATLLFVILNYFAPAGYANRFTPKSLLSDRTVVQRFLLWKAAIAIFCQNPIVGIGGDNYLLLSPKFLPSWMYHERMAHNTFLNIAAEHGLAGLVPFVLMFGIYFWKAFFSAFHSDESSRMAVVASLGVVSAGLTTGMVGHIFSAGTEEWMAIFMGMGLAFACKNKDLANARPPVSA